MPRGTAVIIAVSYISVIGLMYASDTVTRKQRIPLYPHQQPNNK